MIKLLGRVFLSTLPWEGSQVIGLWSACVRWSMCIELLYGAHGRNTDLRACILTSLWYSLFWAPTSFCLRSPISRPNRSREVKSPHWHCWSFNLTVTRSCHLRLKILWGKHVSSPWVYFDVFKTHIIRILNIKILDSDSLGGMQSCIAVRVWFPCLHCSVNFIARAQGDAISTAEGPIHLTQRGVYLLI